MDSEPFLQPTNTSPHPPSPPPPPPQDEETAFHWQAADAALLQPNNLPITKVPRAWERKPLSPFSRQRLRVGKVWKRAAAVRFVMSASSSSSQYAGDDVVPSRGGKRRRRERRSVEGVMKPVKRMRLEGSFCGGLGQESEGMRKIVTRSSGDVGGEKEEMLALSDEEEEGDEVQVDDGTTIEILDEDDTVLDVGADAATGDNDWEDETEGVSSAEEKEDVSDDDALMQVGEVTTEATPTEQEFISGAEAKADSPVTCEQASSSPEQETQPDATLTESSSSSISISSAPRQPIQDLALPEGFVSPIKRRGHPRRDFTGNSHGSRRRTLPVQFAPASLPYALTGSETVASSVSVATPEVVDCEMDVGETAAEVVEEVGDGEEVDEELRDEAEQQSEQEDWEDVEDENSASDATATTEPATIVSLLNTNDVLNVDMIDLPTTDDTSPESNPQTDILPAYTTPSGSTNKLPSSPIPTIEGQHPRLPLRRSPRRKSSSPLKQSTIMPSTESSHLIALTPIKGWSGFHNPFSKETDTDDIPSYPTSPIERAASAPPEAVLQNSPQKVPAKPRISDDTALLQAFLNRAAESKGKDSRRVSATKKRESMTNKQDSDAVRQALASPDTVAKAAADNVLVVLGDLDPNSPSPRKSSSSLSSSQPQREDGEAMAVDSTSTPTTNKDDDDPEQVTAPPTTRRSGRATRRAQPPTATTPAAAAAAAPNRISIRNGNENAVTLKLRTEAQELAALTRNNTRKNKSGAVLPPLRLTKIVSFSSQTNSVDGGGELANVKDVEDGITEAHLANGHGDGAAKGVKWAETLVEFHQGGEASMSESSLLSDELNSQSEQVKDGELMVSLPLPLPPSETPSKPKGKLRRLKPSRTAAMAPTSAVMDGNEKEQEKKQEEIAVSATEDQAASQGKASGTKTKRRSRIATPAKGLLGKGSSSSLLPADLDPAPAAAVERKTTVSAPSKRKPPVSKLPAPASTIASAPLSQGAGQGKENNVLTLTSSPAKKKPAAPALAVGVSTALPTAKLFAPTKIDFGNKAARFDAPSTDANIGTGEGELLVPGLASPAKKGGGKRGALFVNGGVGMGGSQLEGGEVYGGGRGGEREVGMGLSSPAKKRTRRAGGV